MEGYGSLRRRLRLHRRRGQLACLAFSGICACMPAIAETESAIDDAPVSFTLVPRALNDSDIQVFNGAPAQSGDWRSIAISQSIGAGATCTATFVGKGVLLTAAHCVVLGNNRFASPIRIGPFKYRCSVDKVYLSTTVMPSVRHPADYALCLAEPYDGNLPDEFLHLVWDTLDLRAVAQGDVLLVAGYGCVSWAFNQSTGHISETARDKTLAVGDFKVDELQADTFSSESNGKTLSALCAGDSGGPAFSGVNAMNPGGARTIRGVASRRRIDQGTVVSYFASLSSARFAQFLACWKKANPDAYVNIRLAAANAQEAPACVSTL